MAGQTFTGLTGLQQLVEDWHHLLSGNIDIRYNSHHALNFEIKTYQYCMLAK